MAADMDAEAEAEAEGVVEEEEGGVRRAWW